MTVSGPGNEPDEFERLVAAWRAEGTVPDWPERDDESVAPPLDPASPDDEHFVPPEPPPLPHVGPAVAVGLVLLGLGLVLLVAPWLIGVSSTFGLPLGLVAIAAGLTWLLLRLWQSDEEQAGPGDPANPDDGAVV